jgi:hypothetical protein
MAQSCRLPKILPIDDMNELKWMVNPAEFAAEVVLVSASGVLSPGPLFFANIIYGSKMGITAGIRIAYGHTIVELVFPSI